jgi:hypothetical protein
MGAELAAGLVKRWLVAGMLPGIEQHASDRQRAPPDWDLSPALRAKVDRAGVLGAGVSPTGCADASLYRRFCAAGLVDLRFFPQHVSAMPENRADPRRRT